MRDVTLTATRSAFIAEIHVTARVPLRGVTKHAEALEAGREIGEAMRPPGALSAEPGDVRVCVLRDGSEHDD